MSTKVRVVVLTAIGDRVQGEADIEEKTRDVRFEPRYISASSHFYRLSRHSTSSFHQLSATALTMAPKGKLQNLFRILSILLTLLLSRASQLLPVHRPPVRPSSPLPPTKQSSLLPPTTRNVQLQMETLRLPLPTPKLLLPRRLRLMKTQRMKD